jgi:hypothetical protein
VVRDDIQLVATALLKPRADYVPRLVGAREALATRSVDVARQLGVFLDRISDLNVEELRELHRETFSGPSSAELSTTAGRLVADPASGLDARRAIGVLTLALSRLDGDRNPFAYVVRALCLLLLARVSSDAAYGPESGPPSQPHGR